MTVKTYCAFGGCKRLVNLNERYVASTNQKILTQASRVIMQMRFIRVLVGDEQACYTEKPIRYASNAYVRPVKRLE